MREYQQETTEYVATGRHRHKPISGKGSPGYHRKTFTRIISVLSMKKNLRGPSGVAADSGIWNIGKGIAARLSRYGIYDLYGTAHIDEKLLYKEFGVDEEAYHRPCPRAGAVLP